MGAGVNTVDDTSISFRIGVTGHRDILPDDFEAVRQQSAEFLSWLKESMPETGITVISGLADGADRIFAEAALGLNMDVEAVLPMPLSQYKSDFDEASYAELENILDSNSVECIELPLPPGFDSDDSNWSRNQRNELYANLSDDLRLRSNFLVAMWDGQFNGLVGGTGDTILRYLDAPMENHDATRKILEAGSESLDGGSLAYWIPVRRSSSENSGTGFNAEQKPCWLSSSGENIRSWYSAPVDFIQELTHFDQFNSQHAELSRKQSLVSYGNLLDACSEALQQNIPQFKASDNAYTMADSLALFYQARSDRLFKLFSLMAAAMGLLFLVYAKLAAVQFLLIGYLALFFVGVFLSRRGAKQEWFTRHLVYRCLAETLRVRFYLDLSGAHTRIDIRELLQSSGINNFPGFSWIRYVLRSTRPASNISGLSPGEREGRIEAARLNWIEEQATYFQRKAHQLHHRHHKLEKIKGLIIGGLVVAAIILVFFKKTLIGIDLGNHLTLKTLLIFFMGLLPFWLGVWEIYQGKMAVKELMWQYQNQRNQFVKTDVLLKQSTDVGFSRDAIARLGKTSILENCLWIIQRHHREHEPPTAG
jgi:hypothetical protein